MDRLVGEFSIDCFTIVDKNRLGFREGGLFLSILSFNSLVCLALYLSYDITVMHIAEVAFLLVFTFFNLNFIVNKWFCLPKFEVLSSTAAYSVSYTPKKSTNCTCALESWTDHPLRRFVTTIFYSLCLCTKILREMENL